MDKDLKKLIEETIEEFFVTEENILGKEFKLRVQDKVFSVITNPYAGGFRSVAFLPDGKQIASFTYDTKEGAEMYLYKQLQKVIRESVDGMPPSGEEKYSKQEPGGEMGAVNIEEIQKELSEIEESSFRIYNDTLCPLLWDEYQHLNPRVRVNLLRMAYDFYEKTSFKAPIIDIYLMGSAANYNWNPDSDADVHVVIDYNQLQTPPETAEQAIKTAGSQWNNEHKVWVKGHKVEINLQNVKDTKPHVTGIYSLIKDQWVRKPSYQNVQVDKPTIQAKYSGMKKYIETAINSGDREVMKQVKKYLDAFRQYGLDSHGELSTENIVFKILRSKGIIKALKDAITVTYDKEMTVTEESRKHKEDTIKSHLSSLNDDVIRITIQKNESVPGVSYVQVDNISGGKQSHFSSNPEQMNKLGYPMPSTEEFLQLPQGQYKLSDIRKSLKKLSEVSQKDIKSKFPLPSALPSGDIKLNMMTLDNLKSMKEKAERTWKYCQTQEDPQGVEAAKNDFLLFDKEIRKRLEYINAPVTEGYGAGIPEQDRLHIAGERWRIRSKDAPKTPKMKEEEMKTVESLENILTESLPNSTKSPHVKTKSGKSIMDVLPTIIKIAKEGDIIDKIAEYLISQGWTEEDWAHQSIRYLANVNSSITNSIRNSIRNNDRGQPNDQGLYSDLASDFKKSLRNRKKYGIDEGFINTLVEQLLMESPKMETLKKNKKPLTDEERKLVMDGGAVWHHGTNGEETPAVWKSVVDDKTWYVCNTHRAYQCKPTLKGAIKAFEFIETTS